MFLLRRRVDKGLSGLGRWRGVYILRPLLCLLSLLLVAAVCQAQSSKVVSGLQVTSHASGQLLVQWDAPGAAPSDYRVNWARSNQAFPGWRETTGNEFPTTTSVTLQGLVSGAEYKVRVRARYRNGNANGPRPGPFTTAVTQTVMVQAQAQTLVTQIQSLATDRAPLVELYDETDGTNWTNNTNWSTTEALSDWYGVTTDEDGRVTDLRLQSNALSGAIPTDVGDLANLELLSLSRNSLSGTIPADLGDLSNLLELYLNDNDLTGAIPADLGDLADLEVLSLQRNLLSGSIPGDLGDMSSLQELYLHGNGLTGGIPADLGDLTDLEALSLSRNTLSGSIPADLGDLSNLQELYLNDNDLTGGIPADLGNLTDLEVLSLQRNLLSGALPAALGSLTSLQELYLQDNSLSGPIPAELTNLTQLEAFNIRDTTLCVPVANADLQTWTAAIDDFQGENTCPWDFLANADYNVLTSYGSETEIDLSDYLDPDLTGTTSITFTLASCDSSRADYYNSASVSNGKLVLSSNTLGHVHGTNTESDTACTVTGTDGTETRDQVFRLYTVSDRTPQQLASSALSVAAVRPTEVDVQITTSASNSYVRLGWRKTGEQPTFAVVSLANNSSTLTISGLEAATDYEIRAYLMTRQSFDLFRAGNTAAAGTLISETTPASKWLTNLTSSGLGKSRVVTATTQDNPVSSSDDDDDDGSSDDDDDDGSSDDDDDGSSDDDDDDGSSDDDDDDGSSDDDDDGSSDDDDDGSSDDDDDDGSSDDDDDDGSSDDDDDDGSSDDDDDDGSSDDDDDGSSDDDDDDDD